MSETTNYGLNKPSPSDFYDITVHNNNMDILDAKLKEIEEGAASAEHETDYNNPHKVTAESIQAAPTYTYGTEDLEAGVSALETGKLHFVYE